MLSAKSSGLDAIPKVLPHSDENHSLPRLGDAEVHRVHQPGRDFVSGGLQFAHDLGKDQLHLALYHAAHVLHHEHLRLQAAQQAHIFAEKLVPAIVHLPLSGGREALAGRRAVQNVEFSRLQAGDPQAFLHGKLGDVAMPDRNIGKIELEGLDRVVVPLDCEQFPVPGHAVTERRAAAAGEKRDHGRRVWLPSASGAPASRPRGTPDSLLFWKGVSAFRAGEQLHIVGGRLVVLLELDILPERDVGDFHHAKTSQL